MSVASRSAWWAALVVCVATLAGIVIGELTVDLPRVQSTRQLVIGPTGAGIWMFAGLIAWRARPDSKVGPLMVCIAWMHPADPLLGGLLGAHFQWVISAFAPNPVLIVLLALSFPSGRLTRPAVVAVGFALTSWLLRGVSAMLKPSSARCPACGSNPFRDDAESSAVLWDVATPFWIVGWLLTAVILAQRWRAASPPARRALAPMLFGMFQYAIVAVILGRIGFLADGRPDTPGFWSFVLVPVGFLIGMLRTRRHHSVVADLMVDLRAQPGPEELRALLARTLGDPSLELAYWLPDRREYVDAAGSPRPLPPAGVSVLRDDSDEPLAALVYDPALLEDPKLLGAVTAAAQFALENSRLQAELRARLLEVRESRTRLVSATDAERRRIERNLHDGAQQTLLGLRLAVRLARNQAGSDPQALDTLLAEIDDELQGAVEELRTLARGVHPAVLTEEGLEPALAALARHSAIPTEVCYEIPERLPAPIETAVYYVAAEALANVHKHADASRARIDVTRVDGHATLVVSDDGCGGANPQGSGLRGLRDRVEALDGTFTALSSPTTGTRVCAKIPCA
jgi:signal transduction histidine kinase